MKVLDLDFTDLEFRILPLFPKLAAMEHKVEMYSQLRRGKSVYMVHAHNDMLRQGKAALVAKGAKLSHVTLDEIQQPMKRTEQPITLDGFSKSIVSVQVGTALAKTAGLY